VNAEASGDKWRCAVRFGARIVDFRLGDAAELRRG
jgi:hypothetical protein